jgi:high-affinity K+ transport system ATPase subunit B
LGRNESHGADFGFQFQITPWIWVIVLSANFAEAILSDELSGEA